MLSNYHQTYAAKSDADIARRLFAKEAELRRVFNAAKFQPCSDPMRVAVLGCADKRLVRGHQEIFERLLGRSVELITFDITIEHLLGEVRVVQHDCTLPFPDGPFDITYGHVLLKFVELPKQWNVLLESQRALKAGGIAIHVLDVDVEDYSSSLQSLATVSLDRWKQRLTEYGIRWREVPLKTGPELQDDAIALVLFSNR